MFWTREQSTYLTEVFTWTAFIGLETRTKWKDVDSEHTITIAANVLYFTITIQVVWKRSDNFLEALILI